MDWDRRVLTMIAVGATCLAMMGCGDMPIRGMDLRGTDWHVVTVDGVSLSIDLDADLRFAREDAAYRDRSTVVLSSPCGILTAPYHVDTDSDQLEFGTFEGEQLACTEGQELAHGLVIEALSGIRSWRITGDHSIELEGQHRMQLDRTDVASTTSVVATASDAPTPPATFSPTATELPSRFVGDVAELVEHANAYIGTDVRVTGDVGGKSEGAPYTWLVDRAADITVLVLFDTRLYDGRYELSFEQAGEPAEVRGTFLDFTADNIDVVGSPHLDGTDVVEFMNRFGPVPSHLIIARRIITGSGVEYPPDG